MSQKVPFLTFNPLTWCSGPENIAWAMIDGESSWALLDSGSTINAVTPRFIEAHSLDVGPLSDLANGNLGINDFGGVFSWQLGYIIIRVQVEGVWGYDEDQVALVTLETPTINQITVIKESEIYELLAFLNGSRMAPLLSCQQAELSVWGDASIHQTVDLTNLKGVVKKTKKEEVDIFLSKIIHGQMKTSSEGTTCIQ